MTTTTRPRFGTRESRRQRHRANRLRSTSLRPWAEGLEERVVLSTITWNTTVAPTGGDWDTAGNWNGGVLPGPNDIAQISLTGSGTVTHMAAASDSVKSLTTNANTTLNIENGSITLGNGSSTLSGPVTVGASGTLSVGAGATVVANSQTTFSDAGAMTFSSGDQVTLYYTSLNVSGSLTANGVTFLNNNGNITFGPAATLSGGGNAFAPPVYVPYSLVPSLAGNASFGQVDIEAGTMPSGATLALNLIGSNAAMQYLFSAAFTVAAGATVTVGPNVTVVASSQTTFSDAGAMTFSNGDQVTLYYTSLNVSGSLTANGVTFLNNNGNITFGPAATLSGGGNAFALPVYVPYSLVPSLAGNASFGQVDIEAGTMPSGATLALNLIGSNAAMQYVFSAAFTVAAGATMTVGPNVTVVANSQSTFSDAGAMTFSSGDQVTLYYTSLNVSGSLTANGVTFLNNNGEHHVRPGRDTQRRRQRLRPAGLRPLHPRPLARGQRQLRPGRYRGGHHAQRRHPGAQPDRQQRGHAVRVQHPFTVAAGATMTVGPNVTVVANSQSTFSDAGAMTFSSGDQVTLYYTSLNVSGSLTANGVTFLNNNGNITFGPAATLSGGGNAFAPPVYVPYNLVPSLAGNASFGQVDIEAGTMPSGATLALNLIGSNAAMQYLFSAAFTVAAGATVTVGPNVTVVANSQTTFSDAGAMTFSNGDQVTLYYTSLNVSGSLTANGVTFLNNNGNITFGPAATLSGGGNAFAPPVYVPYSLVPSLAGNASFGQVDIEAGTMPSGATLALNLIGSNAAMQYVFSAAFTVAAGATVTVGPNVTVVANSQTTFSDAGAMTFSNGDQVTLYYTSLNVSGSLTANGVTFLNNNGNITFGPAATLSGGGNAFAPPVYVPYSLVPSLAGNASFGQVDIEAGTMPSGATLALNLIGSNAAMQYVFSAAFTVAAGATVTVGPNVTVVATRRRRSATRGR